MIHSFKSYLSRFYFLCPTKVSLSPKAPNALLSWGSSVLRAPALLQGKNVCAGRQPPVSSQLITQLCACLTFGWTWSSGFWALSPAPSSLSLEWSTGCV